MKKVEEKGHPPLPRPELLASLLAFLLSLLQTT